jgi:hypothetical protein
VGGNPIEYIDPPQMIQRAIVAALFLKVTQLVAPGKPEVNGAALCYWSHRSNFLTCAGPD